MKLIKFLFILLLIIVLIVGIPVGIVYYSLSDNVDEAPIDLYEPTLTTNDVIKPIIKKTFDEMGDKYALELSLTEDSLNKMIYSIIKEKVNQEYNPKYGSTDKEININSDLVIPAGTVDFLAGKKVLIKNAYAKYVDNNIYLNLTVDGLGILKSRLVFGFSIETTENEFILKITEAKLGKISLLSGLGKKVFDKLIENGILSEESINQSLKEKNLPLILDLKTLCFSSNKQDFAKWLKDLVLSSGDVDLTVLYFLDILTDSENNMIHLNTTTDALTLKIDLEKLKMEETNYLIPNEIKHDIDFHNFAQSKAQNIVFNMLTSTDKRILFTELEFSQLVYTETNHYQMLMIEKTILDDITLTFKIEGILIDITEEYFNIKLLLNINGLKTIATLECPITYSDVSHTEIHINVPDIVNIGQDLEIHSSFIVSLLENTMKDNSVMPFVNEEDNHYFKLTAQVFDSFVQNASADTPLHVTKIEFVNGYLAVYVECTDTLITNLLDSVTNKIDDVLQSNFLENITFNTNDEQNEAIENITESVNSIASKLEDPNQELSSSDTDKLIEDFSNLSTENQDLFLDAIILQFDSSDGNEFSQLYNSLFNQTE